MVVVVVVVVVEFFLYLFISSSLFPGQDMTLLTAGGGGELAKNTGLREALEEVANQWVQTMFGVLEILKNKQVCFIVSVSCVETEK